MTAIPQEAVAALSFHERMQAYDDFEQALASRRIAHWCRRNKIPGWGHEFHLEMRLALRHWKHFAAAVRKAAGARRIAA